MIEKPLILPFKKAEALATTLRDFAGVDTKVEPAAKDNKYHYIFVSLYTGEKTYWTLLMDSEVPKWCPGVALRNVKDKFKGK